MAGKSLQIDDTYCKAMKIYFRKQGLAIDKYIHLYIGILKSIRTTAIMDGQIADALDDYIEYANRLKGQVYNISKNSSKQIEDFLSAIDEADQYLF